MYLKLIFETGEVLRKRSLPIWGKNEHLVQLPKVSRIQQDPSSFQDGTVRSTDTGKRMMLRGVVTACGRARAAQGGLWLVQRRALAEKVQKKERKPSHMTTQLYEVTPELKEVVGRAKCTRAEAIKKIWEHIKAHELQKDPKDKKSITIDSKLEPIFKGLGSPVSMYRIPTAVSKNFVKKIE